MFNFDEAKVLQEHKNGLSIVGATEKAVDEVIKRGYKNIFYIGIGGTVLYANQMAHIVREEGSTIPLFIENAADFCVVDNPHFSKDSVVVIESISGDTKEVVAAVDKAHEIGATVIGYVEKEGSPLYEKSDYLITTTGGGYYFWYTVTLRFMYHAGQFPRYEKFFEELKNMPENVVEIYKKADEKAAEYARAYQDEPIQYLVGSGNLEDWAVCYGMCIMEEMQWMRTRPISASNFFHGTLEVIDRDTSVILIKGEDKTRPLMDRVENFVHKISAKVTVFDSKEFELKGISDEFRGMLCPIMMRSAFQRVSTHLEYNRRHPLAVRRYYRRLDY